MSAAEIDTDPQYPELLEDPDDDDGNIPVAQLKSIKIFRLVPQEVGPPRTVPVASLRPTSTYDDLCKAVPPGRYLARGHNGKFVGPSRVHTVEASRAGGVAFAAIPGAGPLFETQSGLAMLSNLPHEAQLLLLLNQQHSAAIREDLLTTINALTGLLTTSLQRPQPRDPTPDVQVLQATIATQQKQFDAVVKALDSQRDANTKLQIAKIRAEHEDASPVNTFVSKAGDQLGTIVDLAMQRWGGGEPTPRAPRPDALKGLGDGLESPAPTADAPPAAAAGDPPEWAEDMAKARTLGLPQFLDVPAGSPFPVFAAKASEVIQLYKKAGIEMPQPWFEACKKQILAAVAGNA